MYDAHGFILIIKIEFVVINKKNYLSFNWLMEFVKVDQNYLVGSNL